MLTIRRALPSEIERAHGILVQIPVAAYVGEDDGEMAGSGGLAWEHDRCWLWFKIEKPEPRFAIIAIRQARRLMALAKSLGEPAIYASRDPDAPTSAKLLRIAGFARTDETLDGHEVYKCPLT